MRCPLCGHLSDDHTRRLLTTEELAFLISIGHPIPVAMVVCPTR
jgi:hypothetical protein